MLTAAALFFCAMVLAGPVPKKNGPEWLRNSGARVDEFARQAALASLPPPPAAPAGSVADEGDTTRRRRLAQAGVGLNYQAVAAKSSPAELAHHSLAARHATAASFAPQRHAAWVLGRPCVVLRRKTILPYAWLLYRTRAHRREPLGSASIQRSIRILKKHEPESTTRLMNKLCFLVSRCRYLSWCTSCPTQPSTATTWPGFWLRLLL